jgi:hypothetical protein
MIGVKMVKVEKVDGATAQNKFQKMKMTTEEL